MSFLHVDTMISGCGVVNLLVVDGGIFDHGFYQCMAKAGTICSACFRDEGRIRLPGSAAYFRGFGKQNFASDLNQPFAKGQSGGIDELLHLRKVGVHDNRAGPRPHTWQFLHVLINGSKWGSQQVLVGVPAKSNHLPRTGT